MLKIPADGIVPNIHSSIAWDIFQGRETENNWQRRDEQLNLLAGWLSGDGGDVTSWLSNLRPHYHDILASLQSARTQLVLTCCKFLNALLGKLASEQFDPLVDVTLTALLRICAATKKIIALSGEQVLASAFRLAPMGKVGSLVLVTLGERNASLRQRVTEAFLRVVAVSPERWVGRNAELMKRIVVGAVADATPAVRDFAIELFTLTERHAGLDSQVLLSRMDSISGKQFRQLLSRKRTNLGSLDEADRGFYQRLAVPEHSSAPLATHKEPINGVSSLQEPPLCGDAEPSLPEAAPDHEQERGMFDSDDEHDGQVSIPMQKINLSDRPFDEEPSCERGDSLPETLPPSPSSIPVRSPSLVTTPDASVLALPTPFKNYIFYRDTPASPSQISTLNLIQMLDPTHQSAPTIAVWKKLSIVVPRLGLLDRYVLVERIDALLPLVPIAELAFVGSLLRSMLPGDPALFRARGRVILRILLILSKYFEHHSNAWQDPPLYWVQIEPDCDIETIWEVLKEPEARDDADLIDAGMTFLHGFIRSASEATLGWPMLKSCLINALELWIEAEHANVRKASVALLVAIRKKAGDPLFFQSLPLLSPSQRRLLDAYNSLDV